MAVTIQDIAQYLKLAPSTVSKVLNGYPHVSDQTRSRVLDAADELNYFPSTAARNLRRQRTEKIGFSFGFPVPLMADYVSGIIIGAISAAELQGYNLTLYPSMDDQVSQLTKICRSREVDGILLFGRPQMAETTIPLLQNEGMQFVVVGRPVDDPNVSFVKSDDPKGALEITRHLIEQGHRRIAFTTRPEIGVTSRDRFAGYAKALEEAGIELDEKLVIPTTLNPDSGYHAMFQLLDLDNPPTAVFAIHDLVAIECLRAIRERGLSIPHDIAIAGFDNWRASLAASPPITTTDPPLHDIGFKSMKILLDRLAQPQLPAERLFLPANLVIRESTMK